MIYWHRCTMCNQPGNMKAYEDEMERIAAVLAEKVCKKLGY